MPETGPELRLRVRILAGFAGVRALAHVAGVSEAQVFSALDGNWITPHTAERLRPLAECPVQDALVRLSGHASLVGAGGVRLRLGALYAHGHPMSTVAYRVGVRDERRLHPVLRGLTKRVRPSLWRAVCEVTEPLLRRIPEGDAAMMARGRAHRRGFLSMAQLEEDILDLAEPWRSEEVHRRALELLSSDGPEASVEAARKLKERSEVLREAVRIREAERMRRRRAGAYSGVCEE